MLLSLYRNAYGGLSREAWLLTGVVFINRSGAMVVPFLSVYLTEALGLPIKEVGVLLSVFGMGAMVGNFSGGWLTDRLGHFKVQLLSLLLGGAWLLVVLWFQRFELLVGGLFLLSALTECLSPATASAVSAYSKPENITRAFSLNRLAMNLGFSIGPAVGGMLAMVSYKLLFVADSLTCIAAGAAFFFLFRQRQGNTALSPAPAVPDALTAVSEPMRSPYRDGLFVLFIALCCCYLIAFSQFFTTMPLYWHQVYHLSKMEIGALLAFDGLLVCLMEMVIVYLIGNRYAPWKMIVSGLLLLALSFTLLNLANGVPVLVFSIIFLAFSEILSLPFMASLAAKRSGEQNRGSYMGLYTLAYSVAYIIGPLVGTTIIDSFGFGTLWWGASAVCMVTGAGLFVVVRRLKVS
jgi:predicted MFS family arabinose efflux permease